jgi:hypothetical protein
MVEVWRPASGPIPWAGIRHSRLEYSVAAPALLSEAACACLYPSLVDTTRRALRLSCNPKTGRPLGLLREFGLGHEVRGRMPARNINGQ